jgi:DEAD/DEAH box helicase domain-containing protein
MSRISLLLEALRAERAFAESLRHHELLEAHPAGWSAGLPAAYADLAPVLAGRGIGPLYRHQTRALELVEQGRDVVLATPTASGKSLVYNLPVLQACTRDPEARALYLFPLKALEQDQSRGLERDFAHLAPTPGPPVAIYDGDTSPYRRKKLRETPPQVLVTTPDMLHVGILPHHGTWSRFFRGLRHIVVDELHAYRGIFGSHLAQVLRRLLRVAAFHGARPRIVAASATIANPGELAGALTGRSFEVVRESGAPTPRRHVLLFQPDGSPYTLASRLFRLAVQQGLRTIAFTKARTITELMHAWVVEAQPELAPRISSYRAGFLPEERREIEERLFSGDLLGVISTSALEMGIDVGHLDVCILVGYPGSQIATWQRGGRVGRSREAAIALVAQPDALDQYLVTHPRAFFERGFEHAVVDPQNEEVLAAHLPCAAAEVPLREGEPWLEEEATRRSVGRLEEAGLLLRSASGSEWFASRRLPHRDVSLRDAGQSYSILVEDPRKPKPRLIGSIGAGRVLSECHEGAIYLHRGRQYLVTQLDLELCEVRVRPVEVAYYTRALSEKETEILERRRTRPAGNFRLVEGRVRVTTHITGYERRRIHGQDLLGKESLELPPTSFETVSLWLEIPDEIPEVVRGAGGHPMGGLHANEHAALSLFPLFALCDRHDVAGISSLRHPQLGHPAIFFYDAHPGGVGLVSSLFERVETLLEATLELVRDCPCEEGCPGCVHSPKCGSGNRPIDKAAARHTLELLLGLEPLEGHLPGATSSPSQERAMPATPDREPEPRLVFFDLETQRSAEDVGGWHNAHLMRVALAVLYDSRSATFETFPESRVPDLLKKLQEADLVVGFNIRRFDYQVLRGYTDLDLSTLSTFDLLEAIHARLGFRLSLGHLAEETLGAAKSADGLRALEWWKQGRLEEIERYCRLDVQLLRDLFQHAVAHGHLLFRTRRGERVRLPAPWSVAELLEEARHRPETLPPAPRPREAPHSARTRVSQRRSTRPRSARGPARLRPRPPG